MYWTILAISAISGILYHFYCSIFLRGLKTHKQKFNPHKPFVSVIIAARNEEMNIARCLTSVLNQSYPTELFEVIVAEDSSTDSTATIIDTFTEKFHNLQRMAVKDRDKAKSPKKNALSQAIAVSKGEILMFTDADCVVGQHWIKAMIAQYEDDTAVLAGYSSIHLQDWSKAKLVHKFEFLDFYSLVAANAGAICGGKYFACCGQNFSYRRSAYDHVGGFSRIAHIISGDDINMLQLFRQAKLKIDYSFSRHTSVSTKPITGWWQLINQRIRWSSNIKYQLQLNPELFLYFFTIFGYNIGIILLFFRYWSIALAVLVFKGFMDYRILGYATEIFLVDKKRFRYFIPWLLLQNIYTLIVGPAGLFNLFRWRGRH
ncbi:MAG: glycosyltransferase [Candidatus Cloacimonetes bacterium]|nr:glycosyltransferase [Candidatus Cloacimonadota bacterium]